MLMLNERCEHAIGLCTTQEKNIGKEEIKRECPLLIRIAYKVFARLVKLLSSIPTYFETTKQAEKAWIYESHLDDCRQAPTPTGFCKIFISEWKTKSLDQLNDIWDG